MFWDSQSLLGPRALVLSVRLSVHLSVPSKEERGEEGGDFGLSSPKMDSRSLSVACIESLVRVVRVSISDTGVDTRLSSSWGTLKCTVHTRATCHDYGILPDGMPPRKGFHPPEKLILAGSRFRRRCHYRWRCRSVLGFLQGCNTLSGPRFVRECDLRNEQRLHLGDGHHSRHHGPGLCGSNSVPVGPPVKLQYI